MRSSLTMFCYADLTGAVRGKGFPTVQTQRRLASSIGWTPTNLMFTALGTIAKSPWGPFGDVLLMPDPDTAVCVDFDDHSAPERFTLCDVRNTDGSEWDCCPRTALKRAVEDLRAQTGLSLRATFEHEFVYSGAHSRPADNYALDAVRRHGAFGETYLAALAAAGVEADSYLPEFAPGQFEITVPPMAALKACDTAVIVKEMARATAHRLGHTVSFSPRLTADGLGNGVHIHFSLWDGDGNGDGRPVSHDPDGPSGVSRQAGAFLAGIVCHMPALLAFTAPTPVSYLRLVAHSWTGVWSNIGLRDREAGLRICPTFGSDPAAIGRQFNFEYRPADATANPYLQLAMIIRAGLAGLKEGRAMPAPTCDVDPGTMSVAEQTARSIVRLPASADAAFAALDADPVARSFLPQMLVDAYVANRRAEIELTREWSPDEICRRYAEVY